jgi:hypothetical protein
VAKSPVTLSEPSATEVVVDWAILTDSASSPSDIMGRSGSVKFKPGGSGLTATSKVVNVKLPPDLDVEGDDSYTVELSNRTGGYGLGKAVGVGTIVDDDRWPRWPLLTAGPEWGQKRPDFGANAARISSSLKYSGAESVDAKR